MKHRSAKEQLALLGAQLREHLRNPLKLKIAVLGVGLAMGMLAAISPLNAKIEELQRRAGAEKRRQKVLSQIVDLRAQRERYRARLQDGKDVNDWVQYVLAGTRAHGVKLHEMQPKPNVSVGPYQGVVLQFEVQGEFRRLANFVDWLEHGERIVRLNALRMEKEPHALILKLVMVGLSQGGTNNAR